MKRTIWIDITNTPHCNFLLPIYRDLADDYHFIFTLRTFAETENLFQKKFPGLPYTVISNHKGKNKLHKVLGMIERTMTLSRKVGRFDLKISVGGDAANYIAKLRGKPSITFDDNETAPNWRYSPFSDLAFWPKAVPIDILLSQKFKPEKTFRYSGYKEDIYLADFTPDESFKEMMPFDSYVIVRPENIQANYIRNGNVASITPALLKSLVAQGYNVLYLPRYDIDKSYSFESKQIFVPSHSVDGLTACYFADAVLTGAGTLAREAACLGVPAISFYSGKQMLAVDRQMVRDGWMYHSRDVDDIMQRMSTLSRRDYDSNRCKVVRDEVLQKLREKLTEFLGSPQ